MLTKRESSCLQDHWLDSEHCYAFCSQVSCVWVNVRVLRDNECGTEDWRWSEYWPRSWYNVVRLLQWCLSQGRDQCVLHHWAEVAQKWPPGRHTLNLCRWSAMEVSVFKGWLWLRGLSSRPLTRRSSVCSQSSSSACRSLLGQDTEPLIAPYRKCCP